MDDDYISLDALWQLSIHITLPADDFARALWGKGVEDYADNLDFMASVMADIEALPG